jgi:glycosyltransferase involved in cell wall biosynthesis
VWPGISPAEIRGEPTISRQTLGIRPEARVVGVVGRLQPWKNQHLVIRAVARLRLSGIDAHLLVVGGDAYGLSPKYPARLRTMVSALGLDDSVTFTGQVPDAHPYYAVMDVAVNASAGEPFGIVILEAMQAGVPVVAVDAAGPREILEGEAGGLLIRSPTEEEIADAIARLLVDDQLRLHITERGRERVRTTFSAYRMAREMEQLLRSAADGICRTGAFAIAHC